MDDKTKRRRENFIKTFINPIADEELRKKKEKDYKKACYNADRLLDKIRNLKQEKNNVFHNS